MTIKRPISRQPIPIGARRVFKGKLFDVYQWEQKLFDGSIATFEKLKRPDTAYVIPITADRKLMLADQRQPGATPSIGLIGGRIEAGETPEQGARRELLEETGLIPGNLILWDSYQFLPKLDWAIYTFIAKNCRKIEDQYLDAGEDVKLITVTFDEFLDLVGQENFGDLEVALRVLRILTDPDRLSEMRHLLME